MDLLLLMSKKGHSFTRRTCCNIALKVIEGHQLKRQVIRKSGSPLLPSQAPGFRKTRPSPSPFPAQLALLYTASCSPASPSQRQAGALVVPSTVISETMSAWF